MSVVRLSYLSSRVSVSSSKLQIPAMACQNCAFTRRGWANTGQCHFAKLRMIAELHVQRRLAPTNSGWRRVRFSLTFPDPGSRPVAQRWAAIAYNTSVDVVTMKTYAPLR